MAMRERRVGKACLASSHHAQSEMPGTTSVGLSCSARVLRALLQCLQHGVPRRNAAAVDQASATLAGLAREQWQQRKITTHRGVRLTGCAGVVKELFEPAGCNHDEGPGHVEPDIAVGVLQAARQEHEIAHSGAEDLLLEGDLQGSG